MENIELCINFRIPVFNALDEKLVKNGDRVFKIQFLHSTKWNRFRVCVDGKISNQTVSFLEYNTSKKDRYLSAIQHVLYAETVLSQPKKFLSFNDLKVRYAKGVLKSIQINLLNTETEQKREILEKYNLVFII